MKIWSPLVDKNLIKKSIATKEDKNVVIRATSKGKKFIIEVSLIENINSEIAATEIAGIPRRKEYFAASFLSHPDKSAVEIVIPDLDTPGMIASDWAMPINRLSKYLWLVKVTNLFFEISAKYINVAISNEIIAINKFERRYE